MSDRRRLRRAGERLIVKAFGRCKEGKVNIISAPTGTGKTYNIQYSLIPSEIEEGKTHFLYLTMYTDSVAQEYYDFTQSLFGKARVTKDLQEFLNWDYEETGIPIVLVTTIQGAVNGGKKSDDEEEAKKNKNSSILINHLKNLEFTVFWDEAHLGGSSSAITRRFNLKQSSGDYNASYYKFCKDLAQYGKVAGFTATALFEQQGLLTGICSEQSEHYNFCSTDKEWVTLDELTELTSQIRKIVLYNSDINNGFEVGIKEGITDFLSFCDELNVMVESLMQYNDIYDTISFTPKPIILINGGFASSKGKTSLPLNEVIIIAAKFLKPRIDNDLKIFAKVTENGYFIGSINDVENGTWDPVATFAEFKKKLRNHNDPVQYVFHLEKFKVGLNIENITHEIHVRERQEGLNVGLSIEVTVSPIQLFGRAVRTWFGINFKSTIGRNINFVSDVVDWLIENYKDHSAYEKLRQYLLLCNSHTFYVPHSPVYEAATGQWQDPEKPFAADIELSQFHIVEVNGKLMSVPSQQEKDLTHKQYRKDRCEREGCACYENFVENPPKNTLEHGLSWEEKIKNYEQQLEVHHINEDHNDMRPENLVTLCSNAHGSYSAHDNAGANRYDENGKKIK